MTSEKSEKLATRVTRSISGLVAEYIVAIDVAQVRFPADAFRLLPFESLQLAMFLLPQASAICLWVFGVLFVATSFPVLTQIVPSKTFLGLSHGGQALMQTGRDKTTFLLQLEALAGGYLEAHILDASSHHVRSTST